MPAGRMLQISLVISLSAWAAGTQAQIGTRRPAPSLLLEVSPGELGSARSEKGLLLGIDGQGKQVFLFDKSTARLSVYLESGDLWKKPLTLQGSHGQAFRTPCFRMDAKADWLALSCVNTVALFKPDGSLARQSDSFLLTSDIAAFPAGSWALGLLQVPEGDDRFMGTKERGPKAPRLVQVDRKLEVSGRGLPVGAEERGPNQAAARALMLAAAGQRLYAAEIANYKVYELDRRLKLQTVFENPKLQLEKGRSGSGPDPKKEGELRESTARWLEGSQGNAAAVRQKPAVEGGSLEYVTVVQDIGWDPVSGRVVLLLSRNATESRNVTLDFLDPSTGEVERFALAFPEGAAPGTDLTQLAIGHRFLWLRAHKGNSPTYRLDRLVLEQAEPLRRFRLKSDADN